LSAIRREGAVESIQLTPSTQLPGFNIDLVLKPPYVHLHIQANSRNLSGLEGPWMDSFFNTFLEIIRVAFRAHDMSPRKLADIFRWH
jgi:hypothetical protein